MKKIHNILFKSFYVLLLLTLTSFLVSCQALKPKKVDLRNVPGNAADKRKRNIEEGRGFSAMGAIKNRGKGSGNFSFASSNEMWRATLELLDFTPLQNVDYSGGIIITDWFSDGWYHSVIIAGVVRLQVRTQELIKFNSKLLIHHRNYEFDLKLFVTNNEHSIRSRNHRKCNISSHKFLAGRLAQRFF